MKASPIVHALPYPAIEAGNRSFPEGLYGAELRVSKDGRLVEVEHTISGAPFIEKLIEDDLVRFACLLSVPKAGIRRLIDTGRVGKVDLEDSIMGEPPTLRPVALYVGEDMEHEFTADCGVAELWRGQKITLPKGARIARGSFNKITPSDLSPIRFKQKKELPLGTFKVEQSTEEGFYFIVHAASDVFHFVQNPGDHLTLKDTIVTGVVAQCFSILKHEYGESDDEERSIDDFSNLKLLSEKLHSEFGYDWSDDAFDPAEAATKLYPLHVPTMSSGEDED